MAESPSPLAKATTGLASIAGMKRSSSALLPAFEPCSSPPSLPNPSKRVAREHIGQGGSNNNPLLPSALSDDLGNKKKYPTPVPTSETHIFSSSPPQPGSSSSRTGSRRPGLERTVSSLSQREPLGAVPNVVLDGSGAEVLFGRSGKSSHFQLHSLNKNISRVHLRAAYVPDAGPDQPARVEVLCMGWNGMKIHCQGKHWEMNKNDTFTSEAKGTDVMVDVADTRVVIRWPQQVGRKLTTPESSDEEVELEESPSKRAARLMVHRSPGKGKGRVEEDGEQQQQQQQQQQQRTASSKKPSDDQAATVGPTPDLPAVQIYEDNEDDNEQDFNDGLNPTQASTQILSQYLSMDSDSFATQDFSDADEENDPVVHSFGPMGANLLPKMASFRAGASPDLRRPLHPLRETTSPSRTSLAQSSADIKDAEPGPSAKKPARIIDVSSHPVVNHIVNQLAFGRLNQLPLSMIMNNLPADLKSTTSKGGEASKLSFDDLRDLISATHCVGEVTRVGKDAAGMPLESEYYYVPENDFDESRKEAVVGQLRKPGLRACRKQHKQYFWRKPK